MEIPGRLLVQRNNFNKNLAIIGVFFILIIITLITQYYGSTDIGDYSDVAKFFAGEYHAKIRSSHSYLLGFLHAPFVNITNNFIFFKATSLLFLALIIYSTYIISGRNRRVAWMMTLSPIVWYMAPWINPIQAASLCLLWAYFFMQKYEKTDSLKSLLLSGIFIGLGWAIWDTVLYFGVILALSFMWNKKFYYVPVFIIMIFLGLLPRLILDSYLFNFAFFTTIKTFMSGIANLFGGIYQSEYGHSSLNLATLISFFLAFPIYFWRLYKPSFIAKNKKTIIFLTVSILLLLLNPQMRYVLAISPIIMLYLVKEINEKDFKIYLLFSIVIIIAFVFPYLLQAKYGMKGQLYGVEFSGITQEGINLEKTNRVIELQKDLEQISLEYPGNSFVVGNNPDDYQVLAHFYWGKGIKEFVSVQDYEKWKEGNSVLYQKRFEPLPNIPERRQFWIEGGLKKSDNDPTQYDSILYGLSFDNSLNLDDFDYVKKYGSLSLYRRVEKL